MPLIDIPKDARKGKPPCGECHLHDGETCDICGATKLVVAGDAIFIHVTPKCEHEFSGWRDFDDGRGGEQVCKKCGIGAMAASLRDGL